jgi:osmotically-inducible protein OsmY
VTLSGTVPDWASYRAAEETAGSTRGVLVVNNHLTIAEKD